MKKIYHQKQTGMIIYPRTLAVYGALIVLIAAISIESSSMRLFKRVPNAQENIHLAFTEPVESTLDSSRMTSDAEPEVEQSSSCDSFDDWKAHKNAPPNSGGDDNQGGHSHIDEDTNNHSQRNTADLVGSPNRADQGMIKPPQHMKTEDRMVTFKYFITTLKHVFNLDSDKLLAQLNTWLKVSLGQNNNTGPLFNLSDMIHHTLEFMRVSSDKEGFLKLYEGRSEMEMKRHLMGKFDYITLEEGIELYHPGASEEQRHSIKLFLLGPKAVDGRTSLAADHEYWSPQDLQHLLRHWNHVSGPGKNPTLVSWREFKTQLVDKHFGFETELLNHLTNYLKNLMLWDIGNDDEKIPLEELIHYTILWAEDNNVKYYPKDCSKKTKNLRYIIAYEEAYKEILSGFIARNRILDKTIDSLGIELSKEEKSIFREFAIRRSQEIETSFKLEDLDLNKWEILFEDWKISTSHINSTEKGVEKSNAQEDKISFRYFLILSKCVLKLSSDVVGFLEADLQKNSMNKLVQILTQKSEMDIKDDFIKSYQNLTLEERIEFYHPETSEMQRHSVKQFVLGLSANDETKSSEGRWNFKDTQTLLEHWSKISGPEKDPHSIPLKEFTSLVPEVFGIDATLVNDLNGYFEDLIHFYKIHSVELHKTNSEQQDFSIGEMIHYTLLWIRLNDVKCPWQKTTSPKITWEIEKTLHNSFCELHLDKMIDLTDPVKLKCMVEDWKKETGQIISGTKPPNGDHLGRNKEICPENLDLIISTQMFGIVACRLFLHKYPDFIEFVQYINHFGYLRFSDLLTYTLDWLKSRGEYQATSEEYKAKLISEFEVGLSKISVDEFLKLHPELSCRQKKSFQSFALKNGSTKGIEHSGGLLELSKVDKLFQEWNQRPKWYHISTWWKNMMNRICSLWKRLFGFHP
ncbi:hypothetical protein PGT21_033689 [Puccinia graminis f. sp. tritici]|uniref:Uncharacterized protein n=1 Tax=Puccinia graminis f. sp. tritici TaxID=56615 RepID=A0A5B0NG31_PUCGR|nr:hypothetical protein PGT21_033689 [Puccinia graminis f. sp. tritici]